MDVCVCLWLVMELVVCGWAVWYGLTHPFD